MLIAIRLPDSIEKRILSFPFLHTLKKIYKCFEDDEQLELHLITKEEGIEVLYLLPFNAFYHSLQNDDNLSVLTSYRAYKNLKLNKKFDIFYDLNHNFVDALFGIFLMAKKRVGFNRGNSQYLYSKKIPYNEGIHLKDNYLNLLENKEEVKRLIPREILPLEDLNIDIPFMVFNLDLTEENEIHKDWSEFLTFFEGKRIILVCDSLPLGEQAYTLQGFVQKLPEHSNQIEIFQIENYIEFSKLINYSILFLSYNSSLAYISAYCGVRTFLMNRLVNIQEVAPLDFLGE